MSWLLLNIYSCICGRVHKMLLFSVPQEDTERSLLDFLFWCLIVVKFFFGNEKYAGWGFSMVKIFSDESFCIGDETIIVAIFGFEGFLIIGKIVALLDIWFISFRNLVTWGRLAEGIFVKEKTFFTCFSFFFFLLPSKIFL